LAEGGVAGQPVLQAANPLPLELELEDDDELEPEEELLEEEELLLEAQTGGILLKFGAVVAVVS
jgi:hypothetical protein